MLIFLVYRLGILVDLEIGEEAADRPHADRWIVLIAYLMGLSIGVHLLNLLCIPAIVLVYYYKKFPNPTMKGTLIALLVIPRAFRPARSCLRCHARS